MNKLIDKLNRNKRLSRDEWVSVIESKNYEYATDLAREIADKSFGRRVYIRGLIEISNICKNNCFYCGIRKDSDVSRFCLTKEEILACCDEGFRLGFRTFVMQGGEGGAFSAENISSIVKEIKSRYPDCAVTLSLGEMEKDDYKKLKEAGADRYLLRHESASGELYKKLHPDNMCHKHRLNALYQLKEIGFQTGCGMMIGVPFQTTEDLADDMMFMQEFKPHMVGMGPFVPAKGTPFENYPSGTAEDTIYFVSLCRIMLPHSMLPATTALGSITEGGRERAILAGANVVMPNLSPEEQRGKYLLYDNKIGTKGAPEDTLEQLEKSLAKIGFEIDKGRGDYYEECVPDLDTRGDCNGRS